MNWFKFKRSSLSKIIFLSIFSATSASLTACGGGGGGGGDDGVSIDIRKTGDIFTGEQFEITSNKGAEVDTITSKYGTVTPADDQKSYWNYTFNIDLFKNRDLKFPITETFTVTTSDGTTHSRDYEIPLLDPLIKYQWYIYNNGDNGYQNLGLALAPKKGIDLNLIEAWNQTDSDGNKITGKGVTAMVVDEAVDLTHENIKDNIKNISIPLSKYQKVINSGLSLVKVMMNSDSLHGSAVTGIFAGTGKNNKGMRGEAYGTAVVSYDYFANAGYFPAVAAAVKDLNLINLSLGANHQYTFSENSQMVMDILYENSVPIITSAGNKFEENDFDTKCEEYGTTCAYNQNFDEKYHRNGIKVSSVNSLGERSFYSSVGTNVWISGLGGDQGYDNSSSSSHALVSNLSSYKCLDYAWYIPAYDYYANLWDLYGSPWYEHEDPNYTCLYTSKMNATSAATPTISGIVSLMKQMNKKLTVPQIKYILAKTARNDKTFSTMSVGRVTGKDVDNNNIVLNNGWIDKTNGLRYSEWYGFGLADAGEAVKLAKNCDSDEYCKKREKTESGFIQSKTTSCVPTAGSKYECTLSNFHSYAENEDADDPAKGTPFNGTMEIESVSLINDEFKFTSGSSSKDYCTFNTAEQLNQDNASKTSIKDLSKYFMPLNNLQLELQSPDQVRSIVKPYYSHWAPYTSNKNNTFSNKIMLETNSFYLDKTSGGEWKLTVTSACSIDSNAMNRFKVRIYGYTN